MLQSESRAPLNRNYSGSLLKIPTREHVLGLLFGNTSERGLITSSQVILMNMWQLKFHHPCPLHQDSREVLLESLSYPLWFGHLSLLQFIEQNNKQGPKSWETGRLYKLQILLLIFVPTRARLKLDFSLPNLHLSAGRRALPMLAWAGRWDSLSFIIQRFLCHWGRNSFFLGQR